MVPVAPGDRVVVHGRHGPDREGEIVEVRGPDGGPPYVVRWSHSEIESVFSPGPGTVVHRAGAQAGTG